MTDIEKMKKSELVELIRKERAEAAEAREKEKVFVRCHMCGGDEEFSSMQAARDYIREDMQDNSFHDEGDFTVIVGRELRFEYKPAEIVFEGEAA